MTINDAITRIKLAVFGEVPSDDSSFSDEYIYSRLQTLRAKRLRQRLIQDHFISQFNYTTLDCIPLEWGQFSDCPCVSSDCFILRSKDELPKMLSSRTGSNIQVKTIKGGNISETSITKLEFNEYRKVKVETLGYFIHKNYLYITGSSQMKAVVVIGILSDPIEANTIDLCTTEGELKENCSNPLDEDFPIDDELFDDIESILVQSLMQSKSYTMKDIENNDVDDSSVILPKQNNG